MIKGKIITFYSYKGGVGRTMSLANIATTLALWNKKVLIIDWDLEAPGLEKYFLSYAGNNKLGTKGGVINLIIDKTSKRKVYWKRYLQDINISNKYKLKFIGSGKKDSEYFTKIKQLDIDRLYEKNYGFEFFEGLRQEWKSEFDFILIDSRTGISDIGGICTIQLPDIVLVFTNTNEQSLLGTKEVIERINLTQQSQPYDRQNLIIFPILSRFDTTTEFEISQVWIKKVSDTLKSTFNDWLPIKVELKEFIEKTKIPYFPYFSFGEKISVLEQGFSDPSSMGYAYESLASIIVNDFENIDNFIKNREDYIIQSQKTYSLTSIIKILGVGDGGCNAVYNMYQKGIKDVDFVICNTDSHALDNNSVPVKVQIGESLTGGRGAGSKPEIGRKAAMENISDIMDTLSENTKMVFITTGMGGGTGTGATPVIAKECKEAGFLTIAVVTIPFISEGKARIKTAIDGITKLKDHVDCLLVINNEKLREAYGDQPLSTAFAKADDLLATAVKGIAEIITVTGYINVDFADIETVLSNSGIAFMGSGFASGENRAIKAIENALQSPLLNSFYIAQAGTILLNISTGKGENELTMDELGVITDYIYDVASDDALIIRGLAHDGLLKEEISVTIIATGFKDNILALVTTGTLKGIPIDLMQTSKKHESDNSLNDSIKHFDLNPTHLRTKIKIKETDEHLNIKVTKGLEKNSNAKGEE